MTRYIKVYIFNFICFVQALVDLRNNNNNITKVHRQDIYEAMTRLVQNAECSH